MKVFKELYNYRELLKTNVRKEVRGKYKNSFLGVLWSFLNPLFQLLVYSVIFGSLLGGGNPTYHIYVCVALIPWTFFTSAIQQADFTVIANRKYNTKSIFPESNTSHFGCNQWSYKFYNINNNNFSVMYDIWFRINMACSIISSYIISTICTHIRNFFYSISNNCVCKRLRTYYWSCNDGSILCNTNCI